MNRDKSLQEPDYIFPDDNVSGSSDSNSIRSETAEFDHVEEYETLHGTKDIINRSSPILPNTLQILWCTKMEN